MAWQYVALAAYQVISAAHQAESMRGQAEITRRVNELNANYAELDAFKAEEQGYTQEARYQTVIDQTLGSQKVAMASQDIDIGFGTAKELQAETKLTGMLNQMDIRNQAHAQALGYKTQARNIRLQGDYAVSQANYNASATQTAGNIQAVGSIAQGISGYMKDKAALKALEAAKVK